MIPEDELSNLERTDTGIEEYDLRSPLVFRAMGRERFERPLFEVAFVSVLTLIYFVNGGYGQFQKRGGAIEEIGAVVLLLLFWIVVIIRVYIPWRYMVQVDAQGITLFNGFFRRQVRWNEAFLAEWRPKVLRRDRNGKHSVWTIEIRDAAGQVKMRLDGNLLMPHWGALERRINGEFRRHAK